MWQGKKKLILKIFYNNKIPLTDSTKRKKRKERVTFLFFFNGDNSFQNKEEENF
jgi:hypothetical protein